MLKYIRRSGYKLGSTACQMQVCFTRASRASAYEAVKNKIGHYISVMANLLRTTSSSWAG
jgi:hypothetical protein